MFNFLNKKIRYAIRSPKWRTVRQEHLKRNSMCAACGKKKDLEVHHIKPVHLFPDLELDPENLITLCANSCHLLFGHLMDFKCWNPVVRQDCRSFERRLSEKLCK
jgi:5-methylcytosine-specific restriction protein A